MRSTRDVLQSIVLATFVFAPTLADAHINLLEPPSRYEKQNIKDAPCGDGNDVRSDRVSTFEAGEEITVEWNEYIPHPGHFRIAFDADGTDDFEPPKCVAGCNSSTPEFEGSINDAVLIDGIPHESKEKYTIDVQLPDVTCDSCTLQVIQVMYDKKPYEVPGNDIYYQCADLKLVAPSDGGDVGSGSSDGGGDTSDDVGTKADSGYREMDSDVARTDGSSSDSDAKTRSDSTPNGADESGCSLVSAGESSPAGRLWVLLVAISGILLQLRGRAPDRR